MPRLLIAVSIAIVALVGLSANQCTGEQPSQPAQQTPPAEQKAPTPPAEQTPPQP
jgi:hypothetical protein